MTRGLSKSCDPAAMAGSRVEILKIYIKITTTAMICTGFSSKTHGMAIPIHAKLVQARLTIFQFKNQTFQKCRKNLSVRSKQI